MIEIERKFLVTTTAFKAEAIAIKKIAQGYLNSNPERTVRIRIQDQQGFITIKGKTQPGSISRLEWEREITLAEAEELLKLCEEGSIVKQRYIVPVGNHVFEVDVFEGENDGLFLAEIELGSEHENFEKPDWLGDEVSSDLRYYNSYLSKKPYNNW